MIESQLVVDGDYGWKAVDHRLHPALLPAGTLAEGENVNLEFGDIRPRWGVQEPAWGNTLVSEVTVVYDANGSYATDTFLLVGKRYFWFKTDDDISLTCGSTTLTESGVFTAETIAISFTGTPDVTSKAKVLRASPDGLAVRAMARMHDSMGYEYLVAITCAPRMTQGMDAGRGQAWKIASGTTPLEIPLNGHDVWGACRLVPVRGGMALLRHGKQRNYWDINMSGTSVTTSSRARASNVATIVTASAHGLVTGNIASIVGLGGTGYYALGVEVTRVNDTTFTYASTGADEGTTADTDGDVAGYTALNLNSDVLIFNKTSGLATGDRVRVVFEEGGLNPLTGTEYWIAVSSTNVSFYPTRADALAGTNKIALVAPGTWPAARLYLELNERYASAYDNGAVPLLLQTSVDSGGVPYESYATGFVAATAYVTAKNPAGTTVWAAGNHRLVTGQAVRFDATVGGFTGGTDYYACVLDQDRFTLHASQANALTATSPVASTGTSPTVHEGNIRPAGYSALPLPSGEEGISAVNRLFVAHEDRVAISDAGDWLHFNPWDGAKTSNLGESTGITGLSCLSEETLLIFKRDSVLAVAPLTSGLDELVLRRITNEYGCVAPLTLANVGADVWCLSRSGVISVRQTELGKTQGVALPVSAPLSRKLLQADWVNIEQACGAYFNNRYFCAVPLSGQGGELILNNCVLVYNFLNQAWDGWWSGETLNPVAFARLTVNGKERLCFAGADGHVRYFTEEDLTDGADSISWRARTRGYTADKLQRKHWKRCEAALETWYSRYDVKAIAEGIAEERTLADDEAVSRTASYLHNGTATPGDSTNAGQEDYAVVAGDSGVVAGDDLLAGAFQSVTQSWAVGLRDRVLQLEFSGDRGSTRVKSVMVEAETVGMLPQRQP